MSKFAQNMVNNYKYKREWRKSHRPWLWRGENAIISLIASCEKLIVFFVVVFLSLLLLVFITACFKSFNLQLLIGIAGVVLWATIAIPKTRRSLILSPDPVKSIDRIIVTFSIGFMLFGVGATGIPQSSSSLSSSGTSYRTSSLESDLDYQRKKIEEIALFEKEFVDRYKTNRAQILRSFEENMSAKKYMFVINETDKYISRIPNDVELNQINHRARMEQAELNLISSGAYEKSAEKERIKKEEEQRVRSNCEQDCSVNKYQYNESCLKACMNAHDY